MLCLLLTLLLLSWFFAARTHALEVLLPWYSERGSRSGHEVCELGDCTIHCGACFSLLPEIVFTTEHTDRPNCGTRSPTVLLCNAIPAFPVASCVCDLVCDSACVTHNAHLHQQTFWFSLNFAHELCAVISFRLPMAPGQMKQSLEKDNFWQRRSAKVPGGIETNVILGSGFPIEAAEVKRNPFFIVPLRLKGKCYRTSPWKGVGQILIMTRCASPICSNHSTVLTKIA